MDKKQYKIGKMVYDSDELKQMAKDNLKQHFKLYLGIVIAIIMIIISIGTLMDYLANRVVTKGVLVTLYAVNRETPAFSGEVFAVNCIPYEQRKNYAYLADSVHDEEQSAQMSMILAQKREETKEEIVLQVVYAEEPDPIEVAAALALGNTPISTEVSGNISYSYADANGNYTYLGDYLLTAYCPCPICCGKYSNMVNPITASGNPAVQGVTVAGPPDMPFGTQLVIDNVIYTVQDRGGAIQGKHLDIYFTTHEQAVQFGRKTSAVYLYAPAQ